MATEVFIFLIFASFLLGFYTFFFYYSAKHDKSIKLFISSKKQLQKYLGYLLMIISLLVYLFISRLWNNKKVLNIPKELEKVTSLIEKMELSSLIILAVFWIFCLTFFIMFLSCIANILKRLLVALYLYFLQYKLFELICDKRVDLISKFYWFFFDQVQKITNNNIILDIINFIWPRCMRRVEPFIFKYLLPYLWIYDYMINFGVITKVFIVIPWYYLYSLVRNLNNLIDKHWNSQSWKIASKWYGLPK